VEADDLIIWMSVSGVASYYKTSLCLYLGSIFNEHLLVYEVSKRLTSFIIVFPNAR
jgi:hypothetical protein